MDLTAHQLAQRARAAAARPLRLSLVVPIFNEVENLPVLHARVARALGEQDDWELLLVDDGSTDGSGAAIRKLVEDDARVRGVFFARNRGQSVATCAGIELAAGELIATMDGDLQNDPEDLAALVRALPGHDAVVGRRKKRNDNFVRRASSRIANWIRNTISGDSIQDTGCALKVFRAEAVRSIPFFRGSHRFLPTLLRYHGFSVIEQDVSHHARVAGTSKYGVWNRALPAFLDLLAVRWMKSRVVKIPLDTYTPARTSGEARSRPESERVRGPA